MNTLANKTMYIKNKAKDAILGLLCIALLLAAHLSQAQNVTQKKLPEIQLVKTDGSKVLASNITGKAVIVLFQPDCDHCQREAKEIKAHQDAFKDYSVYFVSPAPLGEIEQFAADYGFKGQANFHFAYTDLMNILNSFGGVETPSLYIYGNDQHLVKAFNGETPIGKILLHI